MTVRFPVGWKATTLGAEFRWSSGGTPKSTNPAYYDGGIPWAIIGDLTDGPIASTARTISAMGLQNSSAKLVDEGSVLIAMYGSIGKLGITATPLATNQAIAFTKPISCSAKYLFWYLYFKRSELVKCGKGGTQSNISQTVLKAFPFLLAPESEQERIVEEIEKQFTRLDAGVAALRRVQANLKRYRAAVLKAACEGRLVPTEAELARAGQADPNFESGEALLARVLAERRKNWKGRGRYSEPTSLDSTDLPQSPEGWAWATLDQIGQEDRPIIYGIIKPGPHVPDGVPYVRVTEMKDGWIDVPNLRRASQERAAKFARATLMAGDVLISKDGTIGRVAVVPPELEGGNITQHVMRAPIHACMLRAFVVWAIRSDGCQHWLTGETRGVALRGVNVEDFRRLPIPVPPFSEQVRIVTEVERRLSVIESLESVVSTNLQRAARLRQSILQKAFTGELI